MKKSSVPAADDAPLYLLEDLKGPELESYTLARRHDTVVQAAEREAAETLADLALSVPQIAPPESCLTSIKTRIQATSRPLPVRMYRRILSVSPGWAAAAALAVLAGWSLMKRSQAEDELARVRLKYQHQEGMPVKGGGGGTPSEEPDHVTPGELQQGEDAILSGGPGRGNRRAAGGKSSSHQLIQDHAALQARLDQLEKRNAQRLQSVPGLHRPVIFEMQRPNDTVSGDGKKLTLSSGKVGDILADALLAGREDPEKKDAVNSDKPPFRIGQSGRDDEILIESGMRDLSVFQLPEEVHVRNLGLPVDQAEANGLQPMADGSSGYYEAKSNLIWRPAADGRGYIGTRPSADFVPPSGGQEVPAPQVTPTPAAVEPAAARAFPIFDESTGQGSIILQNLPPADEGMTWQLWFSDPELAAPFSPGLLPPMETGSGRVFFDLGRTGYAPASCFLTQEPAGGSTQPTGPIILKGP